MKIHEDTIYIKMCEKAAEIQELRPIGQDWELGDFCYYKAKYGKVFGVTGSSNGYDVYIIEHESGEIFLPRQDQLQAMIELKGHKLTQDLFRIFTNWIYTHNYKWNLFYGSPEQLWLAFVMNEKYSKTWNGEDWI